MNLANKKGFTLLELLIVITIIAVLSVILIVALNPAETLRKARDTQRLSDLSSLKTALGIYTTTKTSPLLDNVDNAACQATAGTWAAGDKIWYSVPSITDTDVDGATAAPVVTSATNAGNVDGTGWIKVNLASITGGSPISNLPIDPVNDINTGGSDTAAVTYEALVYRYSCAADDLTFELDARLESEAFLSEDNKSSKDGGNDANYYEVGTALNIIGGGSDAH